MLRMSDPGRGALRMTRPRVRNPRSRSELVKSHSFRPLRQTLMLAALATGAASLVTGGCSPQDSGASQGQGGQSGSKGTGGSGTGGSVGNGGSSGGEGGATGGSSGTGG